MENRKSRFLPLLAILLCMTMIVGATFALFTSKKRINIAVNAAEVDLEASIKDGSLRTFSLGVEQTPGEFELGGTAEITEGRNLELDQMAPGDKAEFIVEIEDKSTIDIMWRVSWTITGELADALVVTRDG